MFKQIDPKMAQFAWDFIHASALLSRTDGEMPNIEREWGRHAYALGPIENRLHEDFIAVVRSMLNAAKKIEGLDYRFETDPFGNTYFTHFGLDKSLPAVQMHSHLDSVPNGGMYDGVAGIAAALLLLAIVIGQKKTRRSFRIVAFRSEESSPHHGVACLGASVATGNITKDELEKIKREDGKRLRDIYSPDDWKRVLASLDEPSITPENTSCVIESHIEQSGHIFEAGKLVGIVDGAIAGAVREVATGAVTLKRIDAKEGAYTACQLRFLGEKNHTGTTPPNTGYIARRKRLYRKDALVGASYVTRLMLKWDFVELLSSETAKDTGFTTVPSEHRVHIVVKTSKMHVFKRRLLALHAPLFDKLGVSFEWKGDGVVTSDEATVIDKLSAGQFVVLPALINMLATEAYLRQGTAIGKTRFTIADYHLTSKGFICKCDGREVDVAEGDILLRTIRAVLVRRFGSQLVLERKSKKDSVPVSPWMVERLQSIAKSRGIDCMLIPSHAGHDTDRHKGIDKAIVFYAQEEGVSHNPREDLKKEHFDLGNEILVPFVLERLNA